MTICGQVCAECKASFERTWISPRWLRKDSGPEMKNIESFFEKLRIHQNGNEDLWFGMRGMQSIFDTYRQPEGVFDGSARIQVLR